MVYCVRVTNPLLATARRGLCFTLTLKTIDYPIQNGHFLGHYLNHRQKTPGAMNQGKFSQLHV